MEGWMDIHKGCNNDVDNSINSGKMEVNLTSTHLWSMSTSPNDKSVVIRVPISRTNDDSSFPCCFIHGIRRADIQDDKKKGKGSSPV